MRSVDDIAARFDSLRGHIKGPDLTEDAIVQTAGTLVLASVLRDCTFSDGEDIAKAIIHLADIVEGRKP